MRATIIIKESRRFSLKALVGLILCCGLVLCINAQQRRPWRLVKQAAVPSQKTIYVNQEPDAEKPDTSPRSPNLEAVFFVDNIRGWAVGDDRTIEFTSNGGQTWTTTTLNLPVNLQGIFFHNERQGWVVGNSESRGVILQTQDGGKNWHVQSKIEGFELSAVQDIWFADEQHGWVVGEAQRNGVVQGIILATHDAGLHWQPQHLTKQSSSTLSVVKFIDAQRGWAVGHNVILYTENGGQKWRTQHHAQGEYFFDVDFINATEGWVVGSGGALLHTTNGGMTWETRQLPVTHQHLWLASVMFVDSFHGWVAGDDGAIFSTEDGGKTWKLESIGEAEYLRDLAATSRSIIAVGNTGIILRRQL